MYPSMPTDKEFEDLFREQLNGLEEMPPLNAWQGIREEIAVKPRRINTSWFIVPALFFLVGIATFLGLRKPAGEQKPVQHTTETGPASQPENSGQPERNATTPFEAGKQEKNGTPAKEELVIPGTERNSVYRTYLAVQKNAAKNTVKAPVLEASAKRNKPMAEVATTAQSEENSANYVAAQKQEALKIAEETSMNLAATATESLAEKTVISQNTNARKQKGVTEAITETFAPQSYPEAIADTVNNMVLEVNYSVQPEKKSWFGRFTHNLRSVFSSGK
jgi:hypothetical protein